MIALLYMMRGRLKGLEGRRVMLGFGQAAIATFVMTLVLVGWMNTTITQPVWLVVIGGVALGAAVYGVMVLAMGVTEARGMLRTFGQYIRGKFA